MTTTARHLKRIKTLLGYSAQAQDGVFASDPIGEIANGTPHADIVWNRFGTPVVCLASGIGDLRIDLYAVTDPALILPIGTQEDAWYAAQGEAVQA